MEDKKNIIPKPADEAANVNGQAAETPQKGTKPGKPLWRRLLKITAWVAGCLIGLLLLLMCLVAWILTPERLTPLVEKYGSEYLKADVKAERVELTIWSSFPHIRLDVTNLHLKSRTLQGLPDSIMMQLGPNPEQLLDVSTLSGSINPWRLLDGTISLGDLTATGLCVNLVSYNDSINNYMIVPESEEKKEETSEPWKIRFGHIDVTAPRIRYFDAAAGMEVLMASTTLSVKPENDECSKLSTRLLGNLSLKLDCETYLNNWPTSLSGPVDMNLNTMDFDLPDYSFSLAIFSGKIKTGVSLGEHPYLKSLSLTLDPIDIASVLGYLPEAMVDEMPMLRQIDTDMTLAIWADIKESWHFDAPNLPNVSVTFEIPDSRFALNDEKGLQMIDIDHLALQGSMLYNGANPAESSLEIPLFSLSGPGMDLQMNATVQEMLSDNPYIIVGSQGELDLNALVALMPDAGSKLNGHVEADAQIKARLEDMMELRYENIEANGSLLIRDLLCEIPSWTLKLYSNLAKFSFGNALADEGSHASGALSARAEIDELEYSSSGILINLNDATLRAGASKELLTRTNGNEITPMGLLLTAGKFKMDSEADTTKIRMNNMRADGSLTRYQGNAESPLLKASFSADRLLYADPTMRLGMKEFDSNISAHLRERKNKGKHKPNGQRARQENVMTVEVDDGVKSLFKTWGINGNLSSDKVRVTHLMYPVPVNLSNLNFDFSLDSVKLHSAYLQSENNALTLSGTISNIRQLMLGRTRKPLTIRLNANIESIDLNQVIYNFMLGSALTEQRGYLARLSPEEQDAIVRAAAAVDTVQSLASDSIPLTLPRNIDALVRLRANKALYGDINMYDMRADLAINDGAASIDSLMATTDFGNAYLNLLYNSRNPELLNLAIDLGFSEIDLQKLFQTFPTITDMAPQLIDLSGVVGAKLVGSFDMYPNMDIDFNSMNAMLNLSGEQLTLEQSPLIRKVAHMMLIRKKGPLEITDMDIQISLHDNVLRLYPFKFGMEKYRFALLGQNDFASNMYYHLSVLKSPIPFKFGINIKGTFDKPKLRFGGAKYKENEAQQMVDLIETQRVNFVKAMRLELRKLINRAAVTYANQPEYDRYGIDKEMKSNGADSGTDDSNFSSPVDMLNNALKVPMIKSLGGSSDIVKAFNDKYVNKEQEDSKSKKKKKK
ncbi:MAG: AsmA-like C-terminal region-containing protein [Muribaculaceae bacterium]|nr:AsmA-like C-terminal region-containing protein [Muribaculaceae bacterium]